MNPAEKQELEFRDFCCSLSVMLWTCSFLKNREGKRHTITHYDWIRLGWTDVNTAGEIVCGSTLSRNENVPCAPASKKEFCTLSRPRLATNTFKDCELSGIRITGAPASISSRILDARCGCSLTCRKSQKEDMKEDQGQG